MAVQPKVTLTQTNYRQAGNTGKSTIGAQVILPKYELTSRDCQGNSASSHFFERAEEHKIDDALPSTRDCRRARSPRRSKLPLSGRFMAGNSSTKLTNNQATMLRATLGTLWCLATTSARGIAGDQS